MKKQLEEILKFIDVLEKRNNQSITFNLHGDGSGAFEDFWNQSPTVSFDTLEELSEILKAEHHDL